MAETFYHLDRHDDLDAREVIRLESVEDLPPADGAALADVYPAGLSEHGRHYGTQDLYGDDPDALWDVVCEAIFELQRTTRYPDRPSRFQSVFGFESLDGLDRFAEKYVDEPCAIREIEADSAFLGDMRLVDAESLADGLRRADRYWRGETDSAEPLWEALLVPPVRVGERVGTWP
jgi:hypothetical protein